ncbi:hypothetical protein [Brevibacterium otitidis]|uniref:Protein kinase domain-containing protein n=1 Tax=Brevibacterium otitidis TaxID=53364 RepID=A0ABV5WYX0_9MICO|nr:hypothetical protein GCM10023233_13680 [Brevibacterium otitidis]
MAEQHWQTVAEVAPGIRRISAGEDTAWFLPNGDMADLTHRWPGTSTQQRRLTADEADVAVVDGRPAHVLGRPRQEDAAGMVVPRFHGGMLADALRSYAGLSLGQTLAVLGACLEALLAAPAPSPGRLRCHRGAFAVDETGAIHLIPGHTVPADTIISEACELGQLTYLALTGLTWEEHGVPVRDLVPRVPEPLAGILIELLEAEAGAGPALDHRLLAQVAASGEPEQIPFVPVEAEVSVSEAVTAQLRVDATVAAGLARRSAEKTKSSSRRGADTPARSTGAKRLRRSRAQQRDAAADRAAQGAAVTGEQERSGIGRLRAAAGVGRRERTRARSKPQSAAQKRVSGTALIGGAVAVLLALAGVATLTGLIDVGSPGSTGGRTAVAEQQPAEPAATEDASRAAHGEEGPTSAADPAEAFAALTRQREDAYSAGDAAALAELTVPGSPAAAADEDADVSRFSGHTISIAIESAVIAAHDGDRAELDVTTHTRTTSPDGESHDYGAVSMRIELRWEADGWRVYDAVDS